MRGGTAYSLATVITNLITILIGVKTASYREPILKHAILINLHILKEGMIGEFDSGAGIGDVNVLRASLGILVIRVYCRIIIVILKLAVESIEEVN